MPREPWMFEEDWVRHRAHDREAPPAVADTAAPFPHPHIPGATVYPALGVTRGSIVALGGVPVGGQRLVVQMAYRSDEGVLARAYREAVTDADGMWELPWPDY